MARKGQIAIQDSIETSEQFTLYLEEHANQVICMEVYAEYCGPSMAMQNILRKIKLELAGDNMVMAKAVSDTIDQLARFRGKSEPTFLFFSKGLTTAIVYGPDSNRLLEVCEQELKHEQEEHETGRQRRKKFQIEEHLPEEMARIEAIQKVEKEIAIREAKKREVTQAARKRRYAARLAAQLPNFNFVLFFPQCHQAHYDLYEKWDPLKVQIAYKEEMMLAEESLQEVFYMSDVELNESCVHALLEGPCLVVMFKKYSDDPRDFVKLMRYALYEEIPEIKEDTPPEKQYPPIPAFMRYAHISKTKQEVRRDRYNAKMKKLQEEQEERERLKAEQERLAKQAEEDRLAEEKIKAEEARMARIAAGLPADEPQPEEAVGEGAGETQGEGEQKEGEDDEGAGAGEGEGEGEGGERVEEEEVPVFDSSVSIEDEEYIPPGGQFVPGLFTPSTDLGKANALAHLFPKVVERNAKVEPETLPPHILLMFPISKRAEVKAAIEPFKDEILQMGVFMGDDPYKAEHVAYSIKHFERLGHPPKFGEHVALMVSRKRSLPVLTLAGLNPVYISSSVEQGERECLAMFPVGYGDDYEEPESDEEEIQKPASMQQQKSRIQTTSKVN